MDDAVGLFSVCNRIRILSEMARAASNLGAGTGLSSSVGSASAY